MVSRTQVPTVVEVDTPARWRACVAVRFAVFVHEQAVPADEELDAEDVLARHWLLRDPAGRPVGTARALAKPDGSWKIGRVAVAREARGKGWGRELMARVLEAAREAGVRVTWLDSQVQAIPFYERLGFVAEGPEFLDVNIPHRRMWRREVPSAPA